MLASAAPVARRRPPQRPLAAAISLLVFAAGVPPALSAQPAAPEAAPPRLVDRVVAVVDEDPILASDVERAIGLGLVAARPEESRDALERRALDGLIEQRLRLHEIGRFGFEEAPLAEVEAQYRKYREGFADEAAFRAELARLGLDENGVRQLFARQLSVLAYVESRLGPRVFVAVEDIGQYYDEVLVPELRAKGETPPPVEEVREPIRALLREQRLDQEIDRWTAELRRDADVVDLLDAPDRELPPERFALP
jgi:hypothetical protein